MAVRMGPKNPPPSPKHPLGPYGTTHRPPVALADNPGNKFAASVQGKGPRTQQEAYTRRQTGGHTKPKARGTQFVGPGSK